MIFATITAMSDTGPTPAQIALHLQGLRESAGLSIPALAELAHLSVDRVVMLESGMIDPSVDELTAYANGLGIRLSVVFRLWERRTPD